MPLLSRSAVLSLLACVTLGALVALSLVIFADPFADSAPATTVPINHIFSSTLQILPPGDYAVPTNPQTPHDIVDWLHQVSGK